MREITTNSTEEYNALPEDEKQKRKERFWDCLWDFLLDGWAAGLIMMDDLKDLPDLAYLLNWVYPTGESVSDLYEKDITDQNALERLIESEGNRLFNEGVLKAGEDATTKTWATMSDDRVRDEHWYLDGMEIPINEKFVTYDGDSAYAPGGFENPELNVNCRCWLTLKK